MGRCEFYAFYRRTSKPKILGSASPLCCRGIAEGSTREIKEVKEVKEVRKITNYTYVY